MYFQLLQMSENRGEDVNLTAVMRAADFVLKQYMGQRKSLESAEVKE